MAYCARSDVEAVFGTKNVEAWANLDNGDVSEPEVLAAIVARIARAIADAQESVDSRLRGGPYEVPFAEPVKPLIRMITERFAGVNLYEARGVQDYQTIDPRVQGAGETKPAHRLAWHKKWAEQALTGLLAGATELDLNRVGTSAPEVVSIDPYT